jgi:hypothetical protein
LAVVCGQRLLVEEPSRINDSFGLGDQVRRLHFKRGGSQAATIDFHVPRVRKKFQVVVNLDWITVCLHALP